MPFYPSFLTPALDSTAANTPAFTVTRTNTDTAATAPTVTSLFRNTGDAAGASDYQNEVHVVLQAGTSADHRRYVNFRGADGVDDGKIGFNANGVLIAYDDNGGAHRLWFENNVTSPNNTGNSHIQSVGSGAIILNGLADTAAGGTGGIQLWSGGAVPAKMFSIDATGHFAAASAALSTRYVGSVAETITFATGGSIGGLLIQPIHSPTANTTVVMNGINANPSTAGAFTLGTIQGMSTIATHAASNTLSNCIGGFFVAQNTVAQTVSAAQAGNFQIQNTNAGGTISTGTGVNVAAPTNSGTMTNYYGVRVLDATAASLTAGFRGGITTGTGKWNLYMDGTANNAIVGPLAVGSVTAPTAFLDIAAGTTAQAQIRLRASTAPTSPNNGDIWYDGTDLKIRLGGATKTVTVA